MNDLIFLSIKTFFFRSAIRSMIRSVIQSVIQSRFCRRHGRSTIRCFKPEEAGYREPRKNKREESKDKVKASR